VVAEAPPAVSTNARKGLLYLLAAALAIGGVLLEGTEGSPWNLWLVYLLPALVLWSGRKHGWTWLRVVAAVVVGAASLYGLVETIGRSHLLTPGGLLMVAGVALATTVDPFEEETSDADRRVRKSKAVLALLLALMAGIAIGVMTG
jgi:hypothetical protein